MMAPPNNATLGAWLDALPPGTRLRVPVQITRSALGISRVSILDADIALSLDQGALGVPLGAAGDGRVWLEGTWGPLIPMHLAAPRTLAVRRLLRPVAHDDVLVVSVIQGK